MKEKTRAIAYILAFMLVSFGARQTAASQSDIASRDWSVRNERGLNALPKDIVWKFMNELWKSDPNVGKLCTFQFANLRHSGVLSLVVSYDGGGTADCDQTNIFDKTSRGFEDYDFNQNGEYDFGSVQDINQNGRYELILETGFAPNRNCTATWPVIYAWNGTGYVDVSNEYQAYYRNQLTQLERQLNQSTPTPGSEEARTLENPPESGGPQYRGQAVPTETTTPSESEMFGDTDCLKAELAKTKRFLGFSPDAGITDAIKWADSDSPGMRRFAVGILTDIGTPEAIEYLQTLSHDEDQLVAWWAKNGLAADAAAKPRVNPMISGQPIQWDPREAAVE